MERDVTFVKEGIKYYSGIFNISVVNFAIKSIGYVLLYGTVEECGLLTHYTDLQIWEQNHFTYRNHTGKKFGGLNFY
jgi:hypothetical protein